MNTDKFIQLNYLEKHRSIRDESRGCHVNVYVQTVIVCVKYYSGHRVDLADGDDGKVVFQVLQTTPIVLASGTYKRDCELKRIILQFLCETRTRLDNYGHTLRAGNKQFPRKCGKYDNVKMMFALIVGREFKRTIIGDIKKIL